VPTHQKSKQQPTVLLLTLLPLLQPLRLLAQLLIVLHKLLLLLRALLIKHFQPQQNLRLAVKQTARAWSVCSSSRCRSKKT
jgi:hypothetical protein